MKSAFIDKNVLMDYIRLVYFAESFDHYKHSAAIVLLVNDKKFNAYISDATPFSVGNYLNFKLERAGISDSDDKTRNALRHIFSGSWNPISLSINEFMSCLENKSTHYEDAYQLTCAKKSCDLIVTRNVRDFNKFKKQIELLSPKQFLDTAFKKETETYFEKLRKIG
ncbi:MAG: hypothetical protein J4432_01955 [DPANN group archaeon]|nr:hypothetical protein [DPANN group archaeon]